MDELSADVSCLFVCLFVVQLMALQSRFGTDERFRMDSRFLEDDVAEEEESGEACRCFWAVFWLLVVSKLLLLNLLESLPSE